MNGRSATIVLILIILSMVLSSCAPGQVLGPSLTPTAVPTDTATATPLPTFTPAPTETPLPTSTPIPFIIQDAKFQKYQKQCSTNVNFTAVSGDSFTLTGGPIGVINGKLVLFCYGAKHTWLGTLTYAGYTFASDSNSPLQFTVTPEGYQYISGTGTVTLPDGTVKNLGISATADISAAFPNLDFSEAFADNLNECPVCSADGDYWTGTRSIENGVLNWTGTSKQSMSSFVTPAKTSLQKKLTDEQVSVRVNQLNQNMKGSYGLVIRENEGSFYVFLVDGKKFAFLLLNQNDWKTLIDWKTNPNLNKNGWNLMTVQATGSHFRLYFNNQLLAETDDTTLTDGLSGMAVMANNNGEKIQLQFDDFEVRLPASPSTTASPTVTP